jgi:hypothetical protein
VLLRTDHNWQFSRLIRQELDRLEIASFDPTVVDELMSNPSNRRLVEILRLLSNRTDSISWASLLFLTHGIGQSFVDYVYSRARASGQQFGLTLLQLYAEGFPNANKAIARRASDVIEGVLAWVDGQTVPDQPPNGGWGAWIIQISGGNVAPAPTQQFADLLLKLDGIVTDAQDIDRYVSQIGPLCRSSILPRRI